MKKGGDRGVERSPGYRVLAVMDVLRSCFLMFLAAFHCSVESCHEISNLWTRQAGSGILCDSTPADFRNAFFSNCTQQSLNESTCNQAWDAFTGAFAYKEPNKVKNGDYINYFKLLPIEVQPNQNLFWSGVFELVSIISCKRSSSCPTGADVVSSANTPSSAIIDNIGLIHWCGTSSISSTDGIDYVNRCLCDVTEAFWAQFSIHFASAARGSVFYLGNGEREGGVFQPSSNFAEYELPRLRPPRVSEVVVMVTHRKRQGESCGNGQTLGELKHKIKEQELKYSCYDVFGNPNSQSQWKHLSSCASRIINAVQQGNIPEPNECFLAEKDNTSPTGPIVGGVLGIIGALAAIVIVLLFFLFVLKHKYHIKLLVNNRTRNRRSVSIVTYSHLLESDAESE